MITEQIAHLAMEEAGGMTVENVCLGLGYTAVQLSDGEAGTCFTFRSDLGPKCGCHGKSRRPDRSSGKGGHRYGNERQPGRGLSGRCVH